MTPLTPTPPLNCSGMRQSWERCLHLRCLIRPTGASMSCLYHLYLGTLSHHSMLLFLIFIISSSRLVVTSPFFHSHSSSSSSSLSPSECLFVIQSAFNTCQPSWGTSYTVRISFVRAPQDVIREIITGPYGWCYVTVPSYRYPINKTTLHHGNHFFLLLRLSNVLLICNWLLLCIHLCN